MKTKYSPEALEKRREYSRKYNREHREELIAKKREKYYRNREAILQKASEQRLLHIEEAREKDREYYRKNVKKIRSVKKKYLNEHPEIAKETREKAYINNIEKHLEYARQYTIRFPEKRRARSVVQNAIKRGILVKQPCSVCGSSETIEAHHEDYGKPLDVIWLCCKHHMEIHKSIKEA